MAQNPAYAQYMFGQLKQQQELQRQQELAPVLLQALGADPSGYGGGIQDVQQYEQPQQQVQQPQQVGGNDLGLFGPIINKAAAETGLTPEEIYQTISKESGFNPNAISPTGPQGLMQLSKAAAIEGGIDPKDRLDPEANIMAGSRYLKQMKDRFGPDYRLAYHDGPTAVSQGSISDAARAYNASFNDPSGPGMFPRQDAPMAGSPAYSGSSKYLPSPTVGGRGVLGQDMDPVRRSHYHFIQQLLESGNPMAVAMATEMMNKAQESQLRDIERTALGKDVAMTNLVPGTKEFSDFVMRAITKPSNQTNINMGQNRNPVLTTQEQKAYLGRVIPGNEPQPYWTNEGPKFANQNSYTEDQGKSAQYATGLLNALTGLDKNYAHGLVDPSKSPEDFVADVVHESRIPGVSEWANSRLSEQRQVFNQAVKEAKVHIIHALTGGGYSSTEAAEKADAYLPSWGDKPLAWANKKEALRKELNALVKRSGPAAPVELRSAVDSLNNYFGSQPKVEPEATPKKSNKLPEGFVEVPWPLK